MLAPDVSRLTQGQHKDKYLLRTITAREEEIISLKVYNDELM